MMRKLFIWMVAIAPIAASGQEIAVSEEIVLKNDYAYHILGKYENRVLLMRERSQKVEVQAFDHELHLAWERELTFEKRKVDVIAAVRGEQVFHIVYGYRHKGDYYVKHRKYDADIQIADTMTIAVIDKLYFTPRFKHAVSENRSKLLLFRTDKETELTVTTYDLNKREVQWSRNLQFRSGYLRRDFREMLVSDDGEMYIVLDHDRTSRRHREFKILHMHGGSKDLVTFEASLGDLYANDIKAIYDNQNRRLLLSGLFNEKNTDRSQGLYLMFVEQGREDVATRFVKFKEALLQDVHGKEVQVSKGVTSFSVQQVIPRHDGGALVIAELNKEYSRRPNTPLRRNHNYGRGAWVDYYFEDLIVFSLHPDGSEHWNAVLHKKQYSQDDDGAYSSFFTFITPEKIRLLYNDEIRQENTVSEYVVRGNGYHKRQSVFSTDYERLKLRFRDAVQVSYDECLVPSERNNRLNLVRIKF